MKRTLILVALFLLSAGLYAQNASVRFQDISVEGSKQEMIQKLQAAGFETMADGVLKGNVDSRYVNISIKTDANNQVKGLVVDEMSTLDAAEAKARFNSLIAQFNADANYVANGANKKEILEKAFFGPITPQVPASILQLHPDVTVIYSEN